MEWEGNFPGDSEVKNQLKEPGDMGLITGLGRSPGAGSGKPTPVFMENSMNGGAWHAAVPEVAESDTS